MTREQFLTDLYREARRRGNTTPEQLRLHWRIHVGHLERQAELAHHDVAEVLMERAARFRGLLAMAEIEEKRKMSLDLEEHAQRVEEAGDETPSVSQKTMPGGVRRLSMADDDAYYFVTVRLTPREREIVEGLLATGLWGADHSACLERVLAAYVRTVPLAERVW